MTASGADDERAGRPVAPVRDKKAYEKDPFYQDLTRFIRRNYRRSRRGIDNARRRRRRATDADFRDRERARRYGLTLEQFRALLEKQGRACAICRRTDRPLALDHCHVTGKVRGFLCRACNVGLGHYDDDPKLTRDRLSRDDERRTCLEHRRCSRAFGHGRTVPRGNGTSTLQARTWV